MRKKRQSSWQCRLALLEPTSLKAACKRLVKLTPGLNFINVLRRAFTLVGPKSVRFQSSGQYLFTLLGSMCSKAAHRTMMKLTPVVNFIKVLHTAFTLVDPKSVKRY